MTTNKMWGGRFEQSVDKLMEDINASIDYDKNLYKYDIQGSIAHCTMLNKQNIISEEESKKIIDGLNIIKNEIETGKFNFRKDLEDIHMNIENRLIELIGDTGGKLHTARSRNDQVITDVKLFVRDISQKTIELIKSLQQTILELSRQHIETIMPGYTHLQTAQPVSFAHHCMAYYEMFERDKKRFENNLNLLDECPLGAAALAGTSFNIDRHFTSQELGFSKPTCNSIDTVSDRDFILDYLYSNSVCAMHLSRLAEELVIWSSSEFNFVRLSDKFSSGSSIMPQKRNPDSAELIRSKASRINSNYVNVIGFMKSLPLAYSKDMQEDKEPIFDSYDNLTICLKVMEGILSSIQINKDSMLKSANKNFSTATDLADWLVQNCNISFRDAHHYTGSIVKLAENNNCQLSDLTLEQLQSIYSKINDSVYKVLTVENSIQSRKSYGGTSFSNIKNIIDSK